MGVYTLLIMEPIAMIGLALFVISEILPFLPIKDNGLAQALLHALRTAFPKPEAK